MHTLSLSFYPSHLVLASCQVTLIYSLQSRYPHAVSDKPQATPMDVIGLRTSS